MASASRKQAVPQAAAGVDTEAALEAFRDPVLSSLPALLDPHARRVGNQVYAAPAAGPDHRPDLPARLQADHHPEGEAARLLDALGRHLRGPALLRSGQQISLIDQTIEDARQKLRDIVLVAYDSLDPALKRELPITRSNTGELAVKFVRHEEAKTNAMFAGTHARGGANSFLWISEWGVIQATDLARSEEILTGALPSVGDGVCVVETTWRGGRNGHLWSLVKSALETPEEQKGPLDWRVVFFPWQDDPSY